MSFASLDDGNAERKRWNEKYRAAASRGLGRKDQPDSFLVQAFFEYVLPAYPKGGRALDLAGGAGRHALWLAKRGWEVTLIDISEVGIEQARRSAGPVASHIHFVVDDLTRFKASQTGLESRFELVLGFFYLERSIFPEIVRTIRPGGLLIYKTYTASQATLPEGPKNRDHLLQPGELLDLAGALHMLHYREEVKARATAELVARRKFELCADCRAMYEHLRRHVAAGRRLHLDLRLWL